MELIPSLEVGLLDGWILMCLFFLIYGILLLIFPKDVVKRLYYRSGENRRKNFAFYLRGLLTLIYFIMICFTPLKIGSNVFILGIILFGLGLAGFVTALFNYKNAPLDHPATTGLYSISRNPQELSFYISLLGINVATGSWLALFIQFIASFFLHSQILAEEKACLMRYGDSYRDYMKRVPRYFLFF